MMMYSCFITLEVKSVLPLKRDPPMTVMVGFYINCVNIVLWGYTKYCLQVHKYNSVLSQIWTPPFSLGYQYFRYTTSILIRKLYLVRVSYIGDVFNQCNNISILLLCYILNLFQISRS